MAFNVSGSFPASIVPTPQKMTLASNFLQWTDSTAGDFVDFAQQYLPELYEQEVERYGNRTLSGFLRMVGAEMPMTSDQVIWSEQNRLHVAYKGVALTDNGAGVLTVQPTLTGTGSNGTTPTASALKAGQTILISDAATGLVTQKLLIKQMNGANTIATVLAYKGTVINATLLAASGAGVNLFVYGSEFKKGSTDSEMASLTPGFTQFNNQPVIIRDKYQVNGSDAAQIGWVEVATEDGQSGYLWYLKAESETRLRFEDYMEMMLVEAEKSTAGLGAGSTINDNFKGSSGLFEAIEDRGNVYSGFAGAAAPGSGALGDFDEILKNLDKQGAIEENMLFLSRSTALDFDDMIAAMNGAYASSAAASYGLFDNEAEMALNFGFSGFRRGSYDFYKTDWKYLNDATTRGLDKAIDGVLVPAGTSTVYDQMLGSNIRRPFLHVRYRASETEDRRFKNWITGSVGGAYTSAEDAMNVHFLTERCLVVQAANNFVLFKGA
jgi:hypothetical protein